MSETPMTLREQEIVAAVQTYRLFSPEAEVRIRLLHESNPRTSRMVVSRGYPLVVTLWLPEYWLDRIYSRRMGCVFTEEKGFGVLVTELVHSHEGDGWDEAYCVRALVGPFRFYRRPRTVATWLGHVVHFGGRWIFDWSSPEKGLERAIREVGESILGTESEIPF